jgi:hypothetical protein
MVRYLSIDNKHRKIDFTRKCSFRPVDSQSERAKVRHMVVEARVEL